MRVLHLTPELPFAPGGTGGSTRQFHLLRRLVERGHEVTVVAPVHASQQEGAELLQATGVRLLDVPRPGSRAAEALSALARRPALALRALRDPVVAWQVEVFWTRLRTRARAALPAADVVHVEHDWAAAWHRDLPAELPRALSLQNLSWAYYASRARAAGSPLLGVEARRFARFDRRHLPAYDLLVTTGEHDSERLRALLPDAEVAVVPNGVDVLALRPAPLPDAPLVLFTGTLSYAPNAEGLLWLLREIVPRLPAGLPVRVVGPDPPAQARALAGTRVELTGRVPAMAPHFAAASVIVVPILSGGGTRLKVLDGLASGRPLVTTTAGADGVAVRDGEHALLADDADAFAAAIMRLVGDRALAARLGAAGRALAEDVYDWRALGDRLEAALTGLAAGDRRSGARSAGRGR